MKGSYVQLLEAALAPALVHAYTACVKDFIAFAAVTASHLGRAHIACFLVHLRDERHLEPLTVKGYVYAMRFFFDVVLGRPELPPLEAPRVTPQAHRRPQPRRGRQTF